MGAIGSRAPAFRKALRKRLFRDLLRAEDVRRARARRRQGSIGLAACRTTDRGEALGDPFAADVPARCVEVEARCMLAFSLMIGNHFMAADHGGRSRAKVLELAAKLLER